MFFKPKLHIKDGKALSISADTLILGVPERFNDYIGKRIAQCVGRTDGTAVESITFTLGIPTGIKRKIRSECTYTDCDEAYVISLGKKTNIYAAKEQGFLFAASTLTQLCRDGSAECGLLYDYPLFGTRGYRAFLPSRAGIADFREMVDLLTYYKYNRIDLEIGGAMEYKRHPEINERWAAFCREIHGHNGRAYQIQKETYPWHKNSIHCDNAEGDILTQDECREIAAFCRSRGLEVVPECPTFSHCDYLVMSHPEIREREGDGYPDTYCPNHPDTYKLVFDILDEVIDVFAPRAINIGHDEMYSIGVCPKCSGTPAPVLYANDVTKIHDFLAERGIKTIMWGEKLLKSVTNEGAPCGGSGHGKGTWHVPALYPCRDLLPKDITFLHWYWAFNYKYDRVYHDRGLNVVYGNLSPLDTKQWNKRREWGMDGGYISNWGSFAEEYMQRNCQYLDIFSGAYAFWHSDFEDKQRDKSIYAIVFEEAFRHKCESISHPIFLTHTTSADIPYEFFYDGVFIDDKKYTLGSYELTYSDGTTAHLPVKFGTNIGCSDFIDAIHQHAFLQLSYGTMPRRMGDGYVYETVYENPMPDKQLVGIRYIPAEGKENAVVDLLGFNVKKHIDEIYKEKTTLGAEREFAMDGGQV